MTVVAMSPFLVAALALAVRLVQVVVDLATRLDLVDRVCLVTSLLAVMVLAPFAAKGQHRAQVSRLGRHVNGAMRGCDLGRPVRQRVAS